MKKVKLILLFVLASYQVHSQQIWSKETLEDSKVSREELYYRKSIPNNFDVYRVDLEQFTSLLVSRRKTLVINLPIESKGLQKFRITERSNLAPELASKYPMIRSYTGYGIDDPTAIAKIDIGTNGVHAIVFSGEHSTVYIDPYTKDNQKYITYKRNSLEKSEQDFVCSTTGSNFSKKENRSFQRNADDGKLRTFRLALAATGEYAQYHLTDQGVSPTATDEAKKAAVLSAMNTTMNRVNGVFERDLSVRMEIVADNENLIFLDANTDGFSNNSSTSLIGEVQSKCDAVIGSSNYDIGHVFSTGGGGLAGLGVVCINGQKASGVTGQTDPINDPFDIDFVAHEMGHQFGAGHTQNNDCQRSNSTAVEPGSGSTIMGYAGICSPNVQNNSDDHFHAVSIDQMWSVIQNSATCAVVTDTNNNAPTANAGPDVSIPKSTPFILKGEATDADGTSSLTYNWEQIDNEIGIMPPTALNLEGPVFRSFPSETSPDRYMPQRSTVLEGKTSSTWEAVPLLARDMNFSFLVRDNNSGGGSTARDDKKVTIVDAVAFKVSSQTASTTVWNAGDTETVTWTKGTSDTAPINCQFVNIKLSTDGGLTFPITILSNTPNDGTQDITVPANPTDKARIMVEAADNIFYNLNANDFTINDATASVSENQLKNFSLYPNPSDGAFKLQFTIGNSDEVSVLLYDIRGKRIKNQKFKNISETFLETITFDDLATGIYLIQVRNGNKFATEKIVIK